MFNEVPSLRRSKWAMQCAERSLNEMKQAASFDDFSHAWQTFLERLEKIWVKVERECQHKANLFQPWQGQFLAIRKSDPLLLYLYQARHADQHSIQPIAANSAGGIQIRIPPLGEVEIKIDHNTGKLQLNGAIIEAIPLPPALLLLSIENRGIKYHPPREHLGNKLSECDPITVAEKGLQFYKDFLQKAEDKFFPALQNATEIDEAKVPRM